MNWKPKPRPKPTATACEDCRQPLTTAEIYFSKKCTKCAAKNRMNGSTTIIVRK